MGQHKSVLTLHPPFQVIFQKRKKNQFLCLHFFKSFILGLLPLAVWITHQQLRTFHKVLARSHPAVLTVADGDERNLKSTARQSRTGSAPSLSAAHHAVDVLLTGHQLCLKLSSDS